MKKVFSEKQIKAEVDRVANLMVKGLQVTEVRKLAKEAVSDPKLIWALITHVASEKPTPAMKASWILAKALEMSENQPEEVFDATLNLITTRQQGGVLRELFKGLMLSQLPENLHGKHIDLCFEFLNIPVVDVAVRYNAMKTLAKYIKKYPELAPELHQSVEFQLGKNTKTFDVMAMRILQEPSKKRKLGNR